MAELTDSQKEQMEGQLQCHSRLVLMAQVLVPRWNQMLVGIFESSQLEGLYIGAYCTTNRCVQARRNLWTLFANYHTAQVSGSETTGHLSPPTKITPSVVVADILSAFQASPTSVPWDQATTDSKRRLF